jgi:F0F1-type ATP synthase assembly protein I
MMISVGTILIIVGAALAVWQWNSVWIFICGAVPLLSLFLGIVLFLIGYSQLKANRFCKKNFNASSAEEN